MSTSLIPNNNITDLDQSYFDYAGNTYIKSFGNITKIVENDNSLLFMNEDGNLFLNGIIVRINLKDTYTKCYYFKNIVGQWKSDSSKSWNIELGAFPSSIIVGVSNEHVDIYNVNTMTSGYWMRFTRNTWNLLQSIPEKVYFSQSSLVFYNSGCFYWIDFSTDTAYKTTTVDAVYNSTISNRNNSSGYTNVLNGAFPNIASVPKYFHADGYYVALSTLNSGIRINLQSKIVSKLVNQECLVCSVDKEGNAIFKSNSDLTGEYNRVAIYDTYCDQYGTNNDQQEKLESYLDSNKMAYMHFGTVSPIAQIASNPRIEFNHTGSYWAADRSDFQVQITMDFNYAVYGAILGGSNMSKYKQWASDISYVLDMNRQQVNYDWAVIRKNNSWRGWPCYAQACTLMSYPWQSDDVTVNNYNDPGMGAITATKWGRDVRDYSQRRNVSQNNWNFINLLDNSSWHAPDSSHYNIWKSATTRCRKVIVVAGQNWVYFDPSVITGIINTCLERGITICAIDERDTGTNNTLSQIVTATNGFYLNNPSSNTVVQAMKNLFASDFVGGFVSVHQIQNNWGSSPTENVCLNKPVVDFGNLNDTKQIISPATTHSKDTGIVFDGTQLTILYESQYLLSTGEVCHTSASGQISVSDWDKIDSISITDNVPVNTTMKYLISFNNRINWKYFISKSISNTNYSYLNFSKLIPGDVEILVDDTPFLPSPPNPMFTPNPMFGYMYLNPHSGAGFEINNYHIVYMNTSWNPTSFSSRILYYLSPLNIGYHNISDTIPISGALPTTSINMLYLISFNDGGIYGYWDTATRSWLGVGSTLEEQDFIDHGMTQQQMYDIPRYAYKQYSQSPYKVRIAVAMKSISSTQTPIFQGASVHHYSNTTGWKNVNDLESDIDTYGMTKTQLLSLTLEDWSDYINEGSFDLALSLGTSNNQLTPEFSEIKIINNSIERSFVPDSSDKITILANNKITVVSGKIALSSENITIYDNQWLMFNTTNFLSLKPGDLVKSISSNYTSPSGTSIGFFFSFDNLSTYSYATWNVNRYEWASFSDDPRTNTNLMMTPATLLSLTQLEFERIRDIGTTETFNLIVLLRTTDNTKIPRITSLIPTYRNFTYLGFYSYNYHGIGGWETDLINVNIPIQSGDETKLDNGVAIYTPNGGARIDSTESVNKPKFIIDLPGDTNTLYFGSDEMPTKTWNDSYLSNSIKILEMNANKNYWLESNNLYSLDLSSHIRGTAIGLNNTTLNEFCLRDSNVVVCGNANVEQLSLNIQNPEVLYENYIESFFGANIPEVFQKTCYIISDLVGLKWYDQSRNLLYQINYNINGLTGCTKFRTENNIIICNHNNYVYFLNFESNECYRIQNGIWEKYNGTTDTLNSSLGWNFHNKNTYGDFDWTGIIVNGFTTIRSDGYWYGITFSVDKIGFITNFNLIQEINWIGSDFIIKDGNLFFSSNNTLYKNLNISNYKRMPLNLIGHGKTSSSEVSWKFGNQSMFYNNQSMGDSTIYYFKFDMTSTFNITFRYLLTSINIGTISVNGNSYGNTISGTTQNLSINQSHLLVGENVITITFPTIDLNRNIDCKIIYILSTTSTFLGDEIASFSCDKISGDNYLLMANFGNCLNLYYESSGAHYHYVDPSTGITGVGVYQIITGNQIRDYWKDSEDNIRIATNLAINKIYGRTLNDGLWNSTYDSSIITNDFKGIRK